MVQSINATTPLEDARAVLAENYDLTFTKAIAKVTAYTYEKVKHAVPEDEWALLAPLIVQINRVKREKNAAILADYHQLAAVCAGIADRVGDDLGLLRDAGRMRQTTFVVAAPLTLAETLKLAYPKRRVLAPDSRVICPLATSITPEDVEAIRAHYPGAKVLAHVNSSLAVKAIADATFTAANALAVVEATEGDRVIMVPDQYLAQNIARKSSKKIITWAGSSDSFGGFTPERVTELRNAHPHIKILAHPQNPPAVAEAADFTGPTTAMADWLKNEKPAEAAILGDDAVADNLTAVSPETRFVKANGGAFSRKRVSLESVLWSLHTLTEEVVIAAEAQRPARAAVQRMLDLSKG